MLRLALLAAVFPTAALAASLPISGSYGTVGSCAQTNDVDYLVDKDGVHSLDLDCRPTKVAGNRVRFTCQLEGNATELRATVIENPSAGTVTIAGLEDKPVTLKRCK